MAKRTRPAPARVAKTPSVRLLSGGNPQIAKADGHEPVLAYIAAMPDWKRAVGERLDALIAKAVPGVARAVKWNSPLWGTRPECWFLGMHCFDRYIKLAFFDGHALRPPLPVGSKDPKTRYLHVSLDEPLDEARFLAWVRQAAALPGWCTRKGA